MATGFKSEEAVAWARKVQNEFDEVSAVLKKVNEVCFASPEEEDEGMKLIFKIGEFLEDGWKELNNTFDEFIISTGKIIEAAGEMVDSVKEGFSRFTNWMKG